MEIKIIDAEYVADRMVINYTEDGKARSLIIAPEEIIRYRNAARQGVRADGAESSDENTFFGNVSDFLQGKGQLPPRR